MDFDDWEPVYEAIIAGFGYDRAADEEARDRLVALLSGERTLALDSLQFGGDTVAIAGAGPSLDGELTVADDADSVVAASSAASTLVDAGVAVDCVVTDLDGNPDLASEYTRAHTPVAVHAHGDNLPAIERHVPSLEPSAVLPTTQAAPTPPAVNTGGFTDGDRAAFLADHCGAADLVFAGWDFDDPTVGPEKARKLEWAERLLYWLERRRGEQFSVLDGRRGGVDASALPIE